MDSYFCIKRRTYAPVGRQRVSHSALRMDTQSTSSNSNSNSNSNLPGPGPSPTNDGTNSTSNRPANKKRRASTTGSRGVANLTPEQLAKKRANDREAQRAIRERTKGQIEALERKILELTSQQPYQDLQHVIRQKELVEAENEDIKRKLNQVLNILQPLLSGNGTSSIRTSQTSFWALDVLKTPF